MSRSVVIGGACERMKTVWTEVDSTKPPARYSSPYSTHILYTVYMYIMCLRYHPTGSVHVRNIRILPFKHP